MTTCGSLFSGYGGADLGLARAGLRHLWLCEVDTSCQRVLSARFPGVPVYGDVTAFPAGEAALPDVVWMSPPCQDLSMAGKRVGLGGERSGLFYAATNVVRAFVLRGWRGILLMEQVPGLLSSNRRRDMACVLASFFELGARDVAWRILDSRWFGVPQRRRRVYLVADFGAERAAQILFEPERLPWGSRSVEAAQESVAAGSRIGADPDCGGEVVSRAAQDAAGDMAPPSAIPIKEATANRWGGVCGPGIGDDGDPMYCLGATPSIQHAVAFNFQESHRFRARTKEANTLIVSQREAVAKGPVVRRLTPVECLRLQGMPDDWCDVPGKPLSDSAVYRMTGNAVTANVAEWIARRCLAAIDSVSTKYL